MKLIGPFRQALTMRGLPARGPLRDGELEVVEEAGLLVDAGRIAKIGPFEALRGEARAGGYEVDPVAGDHVALPGLIDAHTHLCHAGSRAADYALRLAGMSYLEIARRGGGIWSTVARTREAAEEDLARLTRARALRLLAGGVTTAEVKSGYDLTVDGEIRMLRVIGEVSGSGPIDLIPTCLAAHIVPQDFGGSPAEYLHRLAAGLLPEIRARGLARRVDIYIEKTAFSPDEALPYLERARELGFEAVAHADQFSVGGSAVACRVGAASADHLEASGEPEIRLLAGSDTVAVCLPGASLGLGVGYAPARRLLDAGACLAVASDWNPGSAPMGDLLLQAAVLGAAERLSMAETWAAVTVRAARALRLPDRGMLAAGCLADLAAFPAADYREILYRQGGMRPDIVWKEGTAVVRDERL
jgi:imidazolonepropionase